MGAAFFSPATKRIRDHLSRYFNATNIRTTAKWAFLFDPSNKDHIADALDAKNMNLPPRDDKQFGPKLQQRFMLLFERLLASDKQWGTDTHEQIRAAVFEAMKTLTPVTFHLAHQDARGPFGPDRPEYRFVNWYEEDENNGGSFNFLLVCPELPGPTLTRLRRAVSGARKAGRGAKKAAPKKGTASKTASKKVVKSKKAARRKTAR